MTKITDSILPLGIIALGAYVALKVFGGGNGESSPGAQYVQAPGFQELQREIISTPGQYIVPGVVNTPVVVPGQFPIVEAGKNTPIDFFPLGNIPTAEVTLTPQQAGDVYWNLMYGKATQRDEITNAWWQPQTLTELASGPAGLNAAGSPQSDIPVGRNHCPGPGPGAPATDDWHYC